jgi:4-hydroxy-3-methylbut-2-en-1-yl diphosphate reductase
MKSFNVPVQYRSPLINAIKQRRKADDKMKKDFTPTVLDLGSLQVILARHFGFCYGVENAIEIAFRAVEENKGKRIFLLGEMIHNPGINADLQAMGVQFIMDNKGKMLMDWNDLTPADVVIIPAFGTTLEMEQRLRDKGINPTHYETTCPFVEKVWNRAEKTGDDGYTIVVHGKPAHEETRATFSHSRAHTPTMIVRDMAQAQLLGKYIANELPMEQFYTDFKEQFSDGFDPSIDLRRIGVVNQTTMLASDTQAIADYLKQKIIAYYKTTADKTNERFADTRDTLCYATNDNQSAVLGMLEQQADLALVAGGYNSSNTSHLVELCEQKLPTYFINDEHCLISASEIRHFDLNGHNEKVTKNYMPHHKPLRVMVTSGASCPDALVERVIERLALLTGNEGALETIEKEWQVRNDKNTK